MRKAFIVNLAIIGMATASEFSTLKRQLQMAPPQLHDTILPCFSCVSSGYVYCVEGPERKIVEIGKPMPNQICCRDSNSCWQTKNSSWSCTSNYNDPLYSLRVCPFSVASCGSPDGVVLEKEQSPTTFNLTLNPGEVCVYYQETSSGVPAFSLQA